MRPELKMPSDFDISLTGGNIMMLCLHSVVWSLILLIIEAGTFNWIGNLLYLLKKNKIPPRKNIQYDEDVLEEE